MSVSRCGHNVYNWSVSANQRPVLSHRRPIRGQTLFTPGPFHHQGRGLFIFVCHHPGDKLIRLQRISRVFTKTRVLLKVFLHSFTDCEKINDNILFCQSTLAPSFLRSSHIDLSPNQKTAQRIDQSDPSYHVIIVAGMCVTPPISRDTWQVSAWRSEIPWRKLISSVLVTAVTRLVTGIWLLIRE